VPSPKFQLYAVSPALLVEVDASKAHDDPLQLLVNFAVGGVDPEIVIVLVMEFFWPLLSVTVRVTVLVPVCGYVAFTTEPVAVGSGHFPRSQLYAVIGRLSVELLPSSVHVSPVHVHVNAATGGLSGEEITTCFDCVPVRFAASETVSVAVNVPAAYV
jgi:hypothetical protein